MTAPQPALIAVDGVSGDAIVAEARAALAGVPRRVRSGISRWDASGVFEELGMADSEAGKPSARTLMLLYAADLAFRLRWEIRPALAQGRTVVAAPYIDTAMAFARAAGLPEEWLENLFQFAPPATVRRYAPAGVVKRSKRDAGFVEFASALILAPVNGMSRSQLVAGTAAYARAAARAAK